MFCSSCGSKLPDNIRFCTKCGKPIEKSEKKNGKGIIVACLVAGVVTVGCIVGVGIIINMPDVERSRPLEKEEPVDREENIAEERSDNRKEELEHARLLGKYADMMAGMTVYGQFPEDGEEGECYSYLQEWSDNFSSYYTIYDFDGDGQEELLVNVGENDCVASWTYKLYGYDLEKNEVILEFDNFGPEFYTNGAIIATCYHNQTCGYDMPYYAYKFNGRTYDEVAYVETWDESYAQEDEEGNEFPSEIDEDNDGLIYILYDEEYNYSYMDNAEYDRWYNDLIQGAKPVECGDQTEMIDDNYRKYAEQYLDKVVECGKAGRKSDNLDIVESWIEHGFDMNEVMEEIEEKCDGEFVEEDEDSCGYLLLSIENRDVDETALMLSMEDAGLFRYTKEKMGELTACGIYPGMKENKVQKYMDMYGMSQEASYEDEDGNTVTCYCLLVDYISPYIEVHCKDGKVTRIDAGCVSRFAG